MRKQKGNAFWDRWTERTTHYRGYKIKSVGGKNFHVTYRKRGTDFELGRFSTEAAARKAITEDEKHEARRAAEIGREEARRKREAEVERRREEREKKARAAEARRELVRQRQEKKRRQAEKKRKAKSAAADQKTKLQKLREDIAKGYGTSYKALSPGDRRTVDTIAARVGNPARKMRRYSKMIDVKVRRVGNTLKVYLPVRGRGR